MPDQLEVVEVHNRTRKSSVTIVCSPEERAFIKEKNGAVEGLNIENEPKSLKK